MMVAKRAAKRAADRSPPPSPFRPSGLERAVVEAQEEPASEQVEVVGRRAAQPARRLGVEGVHHAGADRQVVASGDVGQEVDDVDFARLQRLFLTDLDQGGGELVGLRRMREPVTTTSPRLVAWSWAEAAAGATLIMAAAVRPAISVEP